MIKKVIYNPPATIILWKDGSKTVVKCAKDDQFDWEKGLSMAILKKICGNSGNFHKIFEKFGPEKDILETEIDSEAMKRSLKTIKNNAVYGLRFQDFTLKSCDKYE